MKASKYPPQFGTREAIDFFRLDSKAVFWLQIECAVTLVRREITDDKTACEVYKSRLFWQWFLRIWDEADEAVLGNAVMKNGTYWIKNPSDGQEKSLSDNSPEGIMRFYQFIHGAETILNIPPSLIREVRAVSKRRAVAAMA